MSDYYRITVRVEDADTGEPQGEVTVFRAAGTSFNVTHEETVRHPFTHEPLFPPRIEEISFTAETPLATEEGIYKMWMPKPEEDA